MYKVTNEKEIIVSFFEKKCYAYPMKESASLVNITKHRDDTDKIRVQSEVNDLAANACASVVVWLIACGSKEREGLVIYGTKQ